jgi:hypothetical protein
VIVSVAKSLLKQEIIDLSTHYVRYGFADGHLENLWEKAYLMRKEGKIDTELDAFITTNLIPYLAKSHGIYHAYLPENADLNDFWILVGRLASKQDIDEFKVFWTVTLANAKNLHPKTEIGIKEQEELLTDIPNEEKESLRRFAYLPMQPMTDANDPRNQQFHNFCIDVANVIVESKRIVIDLPRPQGASWLSSEETRTGA